MLYNENTLATTILIIAILLLIILGLLEPVLKGY